VGSPLDQAISSIVDGRLLVSVATAGLPHARAAVALPAGLKRRAHPDPWLPILLRVRRLGAFAPRVVSSARDLEDAAERCDRTSAFSAWTNANLARSSSRRLLGRRAPAAIAGLPCAAGRGLRVQRSSARRTCPSSDRPALVPPRHAAPTRSDPDRGRPPPPTCLHPERAGQRYARISDEGVRREVERAVANGWQ
jgi:hypothetical protein